MTENLNNQTQLDSSEAPTPKKGRGRPKGSKNKAKSEDPNSRVLKTSFGVVIKNMSSKQKKVLDQLVFSTTPNPGTGYIPSSVLQSTEIKQGRQLPQNDIKKDHLLIRGLELVKNMATGSWEVAVIDTNHGKFGTGEEQTKKINQAIIRAFVTYLKDQVLEDDLKAFIEGER